MISKNTRIIFYLNFFYYVSFFLLKVFFSFFCSLFVFCKQGLNFYYLLLLIPQLSSPLISSRFDFCYTFSCHNIKCVIYLALNRPLWNQSHSSLSPFYQQIAPFHFLKNYFRFIFCFLELLAGFEPATAFALLSCFSICLFKPNLTLRKSALFPRTYSYVQGPHPINRSLLSFFKKN